MTCSDSQSLALNKYSFTKCIVKSGVYEVLLAHFSQNYKGKKVILKEKIVQNINLKMYTKFQQELRKKMTD